jgi:hypothetical protein
VFAQVLLDLLRFQRLRVVEGEEGGLALGSNSVELSPSRVLVTVDEHEVEVVRRAETAQLRSRTAHQVEVALVVELKVLTAEVVWDFVHLQHLLGCHRATAHAPHGKVTQIPPRVLPRWLEDLHCNHKRMAATLVALDDAIIGRCRGAKRFGHGRSGGAADPAPNIHGRPAAIPGAQFEHPLDVWEGGNRLQGSPEGGAFEHLTLLVAVLIWWCREADALIRRCDTLGQGGLCCLSLGIATIGSPTAPAAATAAHLEKPPAVCDILRLQHWRRGHSLQGHVRSERERSHHVEHRS